MIRLLVCTLILSLFSCKSLVEENATADILAINELQRTAHLQNDADMLAESFSDTLVSIQDGVVSVSGKEEVRQKFESYFQSVRYRKWDDFSPPVINVSKDGSMATLIVTKISEAAPVMNDSVGEYSEENWAWMAGFTKEAGQWKMYAISSGKMP